MCMYVRVCLFLFFLSPPPPLSWQQASIIGQSSDSPSYDVNSIAAGVVLVENEIQLAVVIDVGTGLAGE